MFRKKETTPKVEGAVAKAVNYEVTIADIARRSERRAWMVAFAAITMSLILAGGYFYMLPLKEKVPFLVMADAYTGTAAVARLDESFRNRWVTSSEAINRSNVAHYVTMRECTAKRTTACRVSIHNSQAYARNRNSATPPAPWPSRPG